MPAGVPADCRWCQVQWPSKTQAFNYRLRCLTSLSEKEELYYICRTARNATRAATSLLPALERLSKGAF
jgi:hypothetical protein